MYEAPQTLKPARAGLARLKAGLTGFAIPPRRPAAAPPESEGKPEKAPEPTEDEGNADEYEEEGADYDSSEDGEQ